MDRRLLPYFPFFFQQLIKHFIGCIIDVYKRQTPAHPLLQGTKRAELLNKQLIVEKDIAQVHLNDYSHIMLFNAMIDWERIVLPINKKHFIL